MRDDPVTQLLNAKLVLDSLTRLGITHGVGEIVVHSRMTLQKFAGIL